MLDVTDLLSMQQTQLVTLKSWLSKELLRTQALEEATGELSAYVGNAT